MTDAKIIYTHTDEAPLLATYSFLPIVEAYAGAAGVAVETRDISVAARIARRVFPTPPGPTRLTRRPSVSIFLTSASSRRRPMKLVASAGRLPERRAGLAMTLIYTGPLAAPFSRCRIGNSADASATPALLAWRHA